MGEVMILEDRLILTIQFETGRLAVFRGVTVEGAMKIVNRLARFGIRSLEFSK